MFRSSVGGTWAFLVLLILVLVSEMRVNGQRNKKELELMALRKIRENQRISGVGRTQIIPVPMYIPAPQQIIPVVVPSYM